MYSQHTFESAVVPSSDLIGSTKSRRKILRRTTSERYLGGSLLLMYTVVWAEDYSMLITPALRMTAIVMMTQDMNKA